MAKITDKITGKTWEAVRQGDSVIFRCRICGFSVRANVKHYELAFHEILHHIAETHAKPEH